ncbi:MerR family transcriptional regulator [Heyndrickxia sp. NPDC080065]|uniref:MerR family transcriptional regulator n=1 Tax=Heyndrickxia sp. NPDC080065 TaxID=3390568 RepID=UPI003D065152
MNNNQILRAYSIKEVSKIINIPTGTIRQWEKDLDGLLVIPRTQQGARYYTENEIILLTKVKEMRNKNVSKDMIRSLLEKSLHQSSDSTNEITVHAPQEISNELAKEDQKPNIQQFYTVIETNKQELLREFKHEMVVSRNEMIAEIKDELSMAFLQTVNEISKSIQRSNDKRVSEIHEISEAIMNASKQTSETFETLSNDITKGSEATYERLTARIGDSSNENKIVLNEVSESVKDAQSDIKNIAESLDAQQEFLIESLNELKQSTEEIQKREEVFQAMLASYRQAAAAKNKKRKWWKLWT